MTRIISALLAASALSAAAPAAAEVVRFEVTSKTAYGSFRPGEYVLWRGKLHGELAPTEAIPDIDKARRNARGKVEYVSEIMLLMPANPARGNGTLLVLVGKPGPERTLFGIGFVVESVAEAEAPKIMQSVQTLRGKP